MSDLGDIFTAAMGRPDPAAPNGLTFPTPFAQQYWELAYGEIGAGWYLDRFVYLFGPEAARLERCLDAWSFVVPPSPNRKILGRNAYGAILVVEDIDKVKNPVRVLEPYVVAYWTEPNLLFESLFGRYLPDNLIPHFLDRAIYRKWRKQTGVHLESDHILAPIVPEGLGGRRTLDNFRVDDIFEYYEKTAPIYADAFAKAGKSKPAKTPKTKSQRRKR